MKIVAVQAQVTTSDVTFRVPYSDNTTTMAVPLTVTASFITTNAQTLQGYRPPPPPVLFQIPYDVFYPFYMGSAPRGAHVTVAAAVATVVVTVVATAWVTL